MINTFVTNITLIIKVFADLHPKNLRYYFYMFTPNEKNVDDIPNFFLDSAMSWAIALILLEYLMTDKKNYAFERYSHLGTSINNEASNEMLVYLSTVGLDTIKQIPIQFRFGKHHVAAACYPMLYSAVHIIDLSKDPVSA
ncbi:hypothetical protein COOONC_03721 [Cooperia oncophora]